MNGELLMTKAFYACLSLIAFLLSVLILKIFRPGMTFRVAAVSLSALVLCWAILACGDLFSLQSPAVSAVTVKAVPYLKEAGWFAMGLLFGIGRGDFLVRYLDKRDGIDYAQLQAQADLDADRYEERE